MKISNFHIDRAKILIPSDVESETILLLNHPSLIKKEGPDSGLPGQILHLECP
jgi:hypothetical protein